MLTILLSRLAPKSRYVGRHRAGTTEADETTRSEAGTTES